jgi:hypothetical protein
MLYIPRAEVLKDHSTGEVISNISQDTMGEEYIIVMQQKDCRVLDELNKTHFVHFLGGMTKILMDCLFCEGVIDSETYDIVCTLPTATQRNRHLFGYLKKHHLNLDSFQNVLERYSKKLGSLEHLFYEFVHMREVINDYEDQVSICNAL